MHNDTSSASTVDVQLENLKQSLLQVSNSNNSKSANHNQKRKRKSSGSDTSSNKNFKERRNELKDQIQNEEIDILQAHQYLKLLSFQKKCLTNNKMKKIKELNESLQVQQQNYRYLFMVATQANYKILSYPGYYAQLLKQIDNYPKTMFGGIEKDIPRTLMNGHPFQQALKNILIAYAIRNPNLLYCQGMNYLVSYLLINNIPQEQTFWILVCLVEDILPDDFFKDLSTISITTQIFSDIMPYVCPQFSHQMQQMGIDCSLFLVSWYVCLFMKGFINSVSSYLFTRLIVESREKPVGFVLLEISLGIIVTILGRDEPFSFQRQFSSFRDRLQMSVFEISLLEIQLGMQCVELNVENYIKLERHYRQKRQQRHLKALQKDLTNKKFSLPTCKLQYPVCLQRIQIEKKIGNVQEVQIFKNAHSIESCYIQDYFKEKPNKSHLCTIYENIDDCSLARPKHICAEEIMGIPHLSLEKKLTSRISLRDEESFIMEHMQQTKQCIQVGSSSMQVKSRFSKVDSKFIELSGFFVIDEKFGFNQEEVLSDEEQEDEGYSEVQQVKMKQNKNIRQPLTEQEQDYFNLQEQMKNNDISQDWLENGKDQEFVPKNQNQQQQSLAIKQKQVNVQQDLKLNSKKLSKKSSQKSKSQKSIQVSNNSYSSFAPFGLSKAKIVNYFGNTWRRVTKIKEQQLK